jgi:D-alanyl-D-alanine carboxypeptidase/D-alanyl-D-alanine-endopeptidase (penicillin-binding protein 4)
MSKPWGAVVALACVAVPAASAQSLAVRLDHRLDAPGLEHLWWGVEVTDTAGRELFARNAERLFMPASNAKLVVSIVANALLGPGYAVRTSVYGNGPVVNGVLQGDLILYGRGDPTFSRHCYAADTTRPGTCDSSASDRMQHLARQLRQRGIRAVAGNLIGDGSYFEAEQIHPAWESYDLGWWYAAPVSGLGFNDNSLDFHELPGDSTGAPAKLILSPDIGALAVDDRAETGPPGARRTFDIFRSRDGLVYTATGVLPMHSAPKDESAAILDPDRYAALALRHELLAVGIVVRGDVRATTDSFAYRGARAGAPLAEVISRPLRDWLYPILSASQNWFAEMTLKQLGARLGAGGSWAEGLRIERRFLIDSVGIDSTDFSLQDGSGLATSNLVAPHALTELLAFARRRANFDVIESALPQSGKPGTLKNRFAGTPAATMVHAKTGSISGVNTLSGYLERPDGRVLIFSIMANHHTIGSNRMIAAIDSVVVELAKP